MTANRRGIRLRSEVKFRLQPRNYVSPVDAPIGSKPTGKQSDLAAWVNDVEGAYPQGVSWGAITIWLHGLVMFTLAAWLIAFGVIVAYLPFLVVGIVLVAFIGGAFLARFLIRRRHEAMQRMFQNGDATSGSEGGT